MDYVQLRAVQSPAIKCGKYDKKIIYELMWNNDTTNGISVLS